MKVLKEKDMPLLSRKRVIVEIENLKGTPSRLSLIDQVAKHYKTKEKLVIIKHLYSQFGRNVTRAIVHIYSDEKKRDIFEHYNLVKKHDKPITAKTDADEPIQTGKLEEEQLSDDDQADIVETEVADAPNKEQVKDVKKAENIQIEKQDKPKAKPKKA